jgi:hypothetical protein
MEKILCAAIHVKDGEQHVHQPKNIESGFVIAGRRHHNCYYTLSLMNPEYNKLMVGREGQGFITNKDRYVDRREGWEIALASGQIVYGLEASYNNDESVLISENLY